MNPIKKARTRIDARFSRVIAPLIDRPDQTRIPGLKSDGGLEPDAFLVGFKVDVDTFDPLGDLILQMRSA